MKLDEENTMDRDNSADNISDQEQEDTDEPPLKNNALILNNKKYKRGIIYLSTIPQYMNVTKVREIFGQYGELGRVYLQPATNGKKNLSRYYIIFR